LKHEALIYLGADAIAYELDPKNPTVQAFKAGRLFSHKLEKCIEQKTSLIIESTLSGLSLKKHIEYAKELGYRIELVYLFLDSPELCNERIQERVAKGGHFVPPEDVKRRFYRSQKNFWLCYRNFADAWRLVYNAEGSFEYVALSYMNTENILDANRFKFFQESVRAKYDN
jgi:predicted ABC-type ATPase